MVILVLGDVFVVVLLDVKGFMFDDFVLFYFGGSLGRKLLFIVDDIMLKGDEILLVSVEVMII